MGDTSNNGGFTFSRTYQQPFHVTDSQQIYSKPELSYDSSQIMSGNSAFYSQYSALPTTEQRMDNSRVPYAAGGSLSQAGSSFNMSAIASALPDYAAQAQNLQSARPQGSGQPRALGVSTPAMALQMQQSLQYPHQSSNASYGNQGGHGAFGAGQFASYGPTTGNVGGTFPQMHQQRVGAGSQQYSGYSPISPQYYYFQSASSGYPSMPFGAAGALQSSMAGRGMPNSQASMGVDGQDAYLGADGMYQGIHRQTSNTSLNSVPRGPPRKPKQSGHALWVGNLPPGATVLDLKDHFSRDATRDIESLFLISKSNCAFVNYRSEAACQAAMQRFHDSRFNGVRLVCRLRRSSAAASGVPTGPAAMAARRPSITSPTRSPVLVHVSPLAGDIEHTVDGIDGQAGSDVKAPEKFFVVKSLTLQDLEQSVRNGIWATQSHNEQILNKAFQAADNVYLIFSANKSGEYFGYARMTSPINENAAEIMRALPQAEAIVSSDTPKTIPTVATEWAPRGRIIDDSARGTIFWEADLSDEEEDVSDRTSIKQTTSEDGLLGSAQVWGKPFKIEWLSTNRLPFYRTRGLRNPWNANREVKIARDGTELETGVGKRLVQMFHRPGPPPPIQMPMMGLAGQMGSQLAHIGGPGVLYRPGHDHGPSTDTTHSFCAPAGQESVHVAFTLDI